MNQRFTAIIAAGLLAGSAVLADDKLPVLRCGANIYSNVTVLSVSATDVYFTYNNGRGMANAKLKNLSPDLQRHFHFNPARAAQTEQKQAIANAEYRQQAGKSRPAVSSGDRTRTAPTVAVHASDLIWGTDLTRALDQARAEGKTVLLDFTGSDWCPWCVKFDHDVLDTDQFAGYARNKLELVLVDFPRSKPQNGALKQANQALANRYHVTGFPTFVLVNYAGNELGRQVGYASGGPGAFIAELERFSNQ